MWPELSMNQIGSNKREDVDKADKQLEIKHEAAKSKQEGNFLLSCFRSLLMILIICLFLIAFSPAFLSEKWLKNLIKESVKEAKAEIEPEGKSLL